MEADDVLSAARGLETAWSVLAKAHDPEVGPVVRVMTRLVHDQWEELSRDAVLDILARLREIPSGLGQEVTPLARARSERERRRVLQDLTAAVLLSLETKRGLAFARAQDRLAARREGLRLLESGSRRIHGAAQARPRGPVAVQVLDASSPRAARVAQLADADLAMWQTYRVERRLPELRKLVEEALTDVQARVEVLADPEVMPRGKVPLEPEGRRGPRARMGDEVALPEGKAPWPERLVKVFDDATGSELLADSWAYRWDRIGEVLALEAAGVTYAIARATIDDRTTAFCRWVDGRRVSVRRLVQRVERYTEAVRIGDAGKAAAAWPLLSWKRGATPDDFRGDFARLGPPPYHRRCRTKLGPGTAGSR